MRSYICRRLVKHFGMDSTQRIHPLFFDHPRYLPKAGVISGAHFAFVLSVLRFGVGMRFKPFFSTWPIPRQALPWLLAMMMVTLPLFYGWL